MRVEGRFVGSANAEEAKVVAEAVLRHARDTPGETLGVAAFSVTQRDAIVDAVEALRRASPDTEGFFRDAVAEAFAHGRLEFRRMDLDGAPVAMLINFVASPGSFSFKTAFDEAYARYSPGVLIQLDNLASTSRAGVEWMDSCAAQNHPMIDSLWGERRAVVRVSVPLSGWARRARWGIARGLEDGSAWVRRMRNGARSDG